MNYFELFELPTQFDISLDELETHYYRLQKLYHPDRFAMHSKPEQAAAARQSAAINDGFCTLTCSLSRAEHLLGLAGIDLKSEQNTFRCPEFLVQQMEWQEELEAISTQKILNKALTEFSNTIVQQENLLTLRIKNSA